MGIKKQDTLKQKNEIFTRFKPSLGQKLPESEDQIRVRRHWEMSISDTLNWSIWWKITTMISMSASTGHMAAIVWSLVIAQCPTQATVHQSIPSIPSAKPTRIVSNAQRWPTVTLVSANLPDTSTATETEKPFAKTRLGPVNDHSVSVMPCLLELMPQSQVTLTTSTTCSGRLQTATPCGTQRTIPHNAQEAVAESMSHSAAEVILLLSFCSMLLLPSNVVQTDQ